MRHHNIHITGDMRHENHYIHNKGYKRQDAPLFTPNMGHEAQGIMIYTEYGT